MIVVKEKEESQLFRNRKRQWHINTTVMCERLHSNKEILSPTYTTPMRQAAHIQLDSQL